MTSCVRPDSSLSIRQASCSSAGLPSAWPSSTTSVSEPITAACGCRSATARALPAASLATSSARSAPGRSPSSMSAGHTEKSGVISPSSSCLRGDCEAKISCIYSNCSFYIPISVLFDTASVQSAGKAVGKGHFPALGVRLPDFAGPLGGLGGQADASELCADLLPVVLIG